MDKFDTKVVYAPEVGMMMQNVALKGKPLVVLELDHVIDPKK